MYQYVSFTCTCPRYVASFGSLAFDIDSGAVPIDQCPRGESVSHVMQPRTASVALALAGRADRSGGRSWRRCSVRSIR